MSMQWMTVREMLLSFGVPEEEITAGVLAAVEHILTVSGVANKEINYSVLQTPYGITRMEEPDAGAL